jgi:hypothetical protein
VLLALVGVLDADDSIAVLDEFGDMAFLRTWTRSDIVMARSSMRSSWA